MSGRYAPYPEYKRAEEVWLGSIPVGWHVRRGKYTFREHTELSESGSEELLSVSEYFGVKPRGDTIEADEYLTRADSLVGYKKCSVNDLAMNIMLAWKKGLGVSKYEGIVSPAYSVFRFLPHAHPDYMHYLLRTNLYADHFKSRSTGIMDSRLRLYPDAFGDVSILLPSVSEQEHIAAFLDHETAKIDALIEKQQQLIALLKEKRQAVISHAVTKGLNPDAPMRDSGVEWLGKVPAHWKVGALGYYAELNTGATPDRSKPSYWSGHIPWIKTGEVNYAPIVEAEENITETGFRNSAVRISPTGTLLMAMYGQGVTRGRVALLGVPATYNQACVAISGCPGVSNSFLRLFFMAAYDAIRDGGNLTSQMNLNLEIVKKLKIAVPPPEEQSRIENFLGDKLPKLDKLLELAESVIRAIADRRTTLISAAVTGKIDVRDWKPSEPEAKAA